MKIICVSVFALVSSLGALSVSEKWAARLESADVAYQAAVAKADNARFYALQKAGQERSKVLKSALTDATKAGDFDAATEIKVRLAAGGVRARPKDVAKFGGHEYALIEEKATWHVAKRLCEEMGGHLATINTSQEARFLITVCGKHDAWVGASDEAAEDHWTWVDGTPCNESAKAMWRLTDQTGEQHNLLWFTPDQQWAAGRGGARVAYLCEWE